MTKNTQELLKALPAVDKVLQLNSVEQLIERHGRTNVVNAIRTAIDAARAAVLKGEEMNCTPQGITTLAIEIINRGSASKLKRVVNATGIVLHTGLGRATMPEAARQALWDLAGSCNVQVDLATGARIKREDCLLDLVRDLTGAEDALLVNNNAGATMLVLRALAEGKEAIVSRGELIEIGGSFRLPEIMAQSGAILKEVGSTNKTHLRDYENAIGDKTGLILKAHKSNYQIVGFTKEVGIAEIVDVGHKHNIPVVDDIGAGALIGLEQFGVEHEMTVGESITAGADLVLFSTDKLIGGPQGGMIVGKTELVTRIRKHPLYRSLRVCKMTLAALSATLQLFKEPELLMAKHPLYAMIGKGLAYMEKQAQDLAGQIAGKRPDWNVSVVKEESFLGSGSLPGEAHPAYAVSIRSEQESTEGIACSFRSAAVPVFPHISDDTVRLNMRTLFPKEMTDVINAIPKTNTAGA